MIESNLNSNELRQLILPMLNLEDLSTVFKKLAPILNPWAKDVEELICQNRIHVVYKKFTINITLLKELSGNGCSFIFQSRRPKKWRDRFYNPSKRMVKELQEICEEAVSRLAFKRYTYQWQENTYKPSTTLEYYHIWRAFNPDWKEALEISPLFIGTDENEDFYFVSLHFNAECYEYLDGKTSLKENWQKHIYDVTNYIDKEANRRMGLS